MGLLDQARAGDQRALARLATLIENDDRGAIVALDSLGMPTGEVYVLGITGSPGAGKSSLINCLLPELQKGDQRIAVLLVDPSSQISGGAVLGDRIRMLERGGPNMFVRSQATRGQEGGLAPSTATLIDLFGHVGFDLALIETVGVGQDGIDIRAVCDTTVVVQSPHQGDSVQSLKAGILEIADIFAVTKADLPGAQQVVRDLNAMIHLTGATADGWSPPVVAVSSTNGTGFQELTTQIARHRTHVKVQPPVDRRATRLRWEITKRATTRLTEAVRRRQAEWDVEQSREARIRAVLELAARDLGD
jgi:LAO/AO transport system kinase